MIVRVTRTELDLWRNNRKGEAVDRVCRRAKVTINVAAFSLADALHATYPPDILEDDA